MVLACILCIGLYWAAFVLGAIASASRAGWNDTVRWSHLAEAASRFEIAWLAEYLGPFDVLFFVSSTVTLVVVALAERSSRWFPLRCFSFAVQPFLFPHGATLGVLLLPSEVWGLARDDGYDREGAVEMGPTLAALGVWRIVSIVAAVVDGRRRRTAGRFPDGPPLGRVARPDPRHFLGGAAG